MSILGLGQSWANITQFSLKSGWVQSTLNFRRNRTYSKMSKLGEFHSTSLNKREQDVEDWQLTLYTLNGSYVMFVTNWSFFVFVIFYFFFHHNVTQIFSPNLTFINLLDPSCGRQPITHKIIKFQSSSKLHINKPPSHVPNSTAIRTLIWVRNFGELHCFCVPTFGPKVERVFLARNFPFVSFDSLLSSYAKTHTLRLRFSISVGESGRKEYFKLIRLYISRNLFCRPTSVEFRIILQSSKNCFNLHKKKSCLSEVIKSAKKT